MFVGTNFSYNGISGQDMYGLMLVRDSSGMFSQNFGIKRKTITDKLKNKSTVIDYGTEDEILSFECTFAKESAWTYEQRVEVSKWFFTDKYCDLESEDYPLVFKVKAIEGEFSNTGLNQGFLTVKWEANSSHAYSPVEVSSFDLSNNETTQLVEIYNKSNHPNYYYYKPELEFTLDAISTGFKIENLTIGGEVFEFTGLSNSEKIYINNDTERIISNVSDTRYTNLTDHRFFRLAYGKNQLRIIGKGILEFRHQFPMMV